MKDIKSVMIGFLLATSMFLFMGQTKATNSEIGGYQAFADDEREYLVDTMTGQMWKAIRGGANVGYKRYWKLLIPPNDFRDK